MLALGSSVVSTTFSADGEFVGGFNIKLSLLNQLPKLFPPIIEPDKVIRGFHWQNIVQHLLVGNLIIKDED